MKHIDKNCIPEEIKSGVYIYGGGYTGKIIVDLLKERKVPVLKIIDDDEGLQGTRIKGITVISLNDFQSIINENEKTNVILSSIYGKRILNKLNRINTIEVYEMYEWFLNSITGVCLNQFADIRNEDIYRFKQNFEQCKSYINDDISRTTIDGIIEFVETRDLKILAEICTEEEQYFIPEVTSKMKNEELVIIDGGAYRGELFQALKENEAKVKKWFCLEPDEENYNLLLKQKERIGIGQKQVCIKKGLWNERKRMYFLGGNQTGSKLVDFETKDYIETTTIDEIMLDYSEHCDFIKMDIEGAELPALVGGFKTIKKDRPILAICIYHSINDFWKIPQYLFSSLRNYSWYIRHHALVFNETVLYGIPNEK